MERCPTGIGRSFLIPQPFEKLTVFENFAAAAAHGGRLIEAVVLADCADILEPTEMIGCANTQARTIITGMR